MDKKGFTLIELLTVIAILGILVLLGTPKFLGFSEQARLAQIKNDSKAHETVLNLEMINNPDYIDYIFQSWKQANYAELMKASEQGLIYNKTGKTTLERICDNSTNECFEMPANYVNSRLPGKFVANKGGEVFYIHSVDVEKDVGQEIPTESKYNEPPPYSNPESDFEGEFITEEQLLEELNEELANGHINQIVYNKMIENIEDIFVITDYIGTSTDVVIPERIKGGAVRFIRNYSFNKKGLTSVYIPNTVNDINAHSFSNNSIEHLTLPSGLIHVFEEAFFGNPLKTVKFGNEVSYIGEQAFSYTNLTEIKLPKSLKMIDETAFSFNPDLKKIYSHSNLNLDHKFNTNAEVIYIK